MDKIQKDWRVNDSSPSAGSLKSCSAGRMDQAKRFAMMNFDHWNDITCFVEPHTGCYYEIGKLIEDAVEFGFGVAHGQTWKTICKRIK